jgi:hypothetical protein
MDPLSPSLSLYFELARRTTTYIILYIHQLNIKGAYLNGTLKERVYMKQPEGYDNRTGRVCHLIKTLYGLKQARREWNIELDMKLRKHGYQHLRSNPCIYIR